MQKDAPPIYQSNSKIRPMITTSQFRSLVNRNPDEIAPCNQQLQAIYTVVGLKPESSFFSLQLAIDHVTRRLQAKLCQKWSVIREALDDLQRRLVVEHVLENRNSERPLVIATVIWDSINGTQPTFEDSSLDWSHIIHLASMLADLSPRTYNFQQLTILRRFDRYFEFAVATIRLRQAGFCYALEDGRVTYSNDERQRIAARISELISRVGVIHFLRKLFSRIAPLYSLEMQRFLVSRSYDNLSLNAPILPVGYLIHLCAHKLSPDHFNDRHAFANFLSHAADSTMLANGLTPAELDNIAREDQFNQICHLATDFASHYDVQPYNAAAFLTLNPSNLITFVKEVAIYDKLYCLPQFRASDVNEFIRNIFDWLTPLHEAELGGSIENVAQILDAIIHTSAPKLTISFVTTREIVMHCSSLPESLVRQVLPLFARVNASTEGFPLPETPEPSTHFAKPLIKISDDTYAILNTPIAASAVFEPLALRLLDIDDQTFSKMGLAAEGFMRQRLHRSNIQVIFGAYHVGQYQSDCDAVIETSDTVFFIELKIKSFTRLARAGDDFKILTDLSNTLLSALKQANQHEIALRNLTTLPLRTFDGDLYHLQLAGRKVEKISLALTDFGGFQDRTVIMQLLNVLMNVGIGAIDPNHDVRSLNTLIQKIRSQMQQLARLTSDDRVWHFFNCWFLSLPQFLMFVENASSAETLKEQLWAVRHFTTLSLDAYVEYHKVQFLRGASPQSV